MRKYDFYSDPGHGWLKVKRQELVELGIESQISGFSYQRGDFVYLEEDGDASKFADAWEQKHQVKFMNSQITYHIADRASRIRTYEPFNPKILCELCGCFTSLPKHHKGKQLCEQCYPGEMYQQQCKDCDSIFIDPHELVKCPFCGSKRLEINEMEEGANH